MAQVAPVSHSSASAKETGVLQVVAQAQDQDTASDLPDGSSNGDPTFVLSTQQENRVWNTIDKRIVPIITAIYLMSFVDKGNIANAKLQGLVTQLELMGNEYNIALTMYFVSYCLCTIPANLLLKKVRPSRWLPGLAITWGTITTLMGLVKTYPQLVGARIALGAAEAGLSSGIFYYMTMWYPRYMVQYRIGLCYGGATIAGAFSGLVAYGIAFMSGTAGLLGWSWIFILEGIVTVLVGLVALLVFVDLPDSARFLSPDERAYVIYRKKYDNSSVGEEEHFEVRHILEGVLDWQVWALAMVSCVNSICVFFQFIKSYSALTLISNFGYNPTISQLLSVPPYAAATIAVITWAIWSDRVQMRSPFVFAGYALMLVSFAINISHASAGVKYFGTYLAIIGGYAAFPAIVSWLGNNVVGHYKRGVALGVQLLFGSLGGVIASNIYHVRDAPLYIHGHTIELGVACGGLVLVPLIVLAYSRINARRGVAQRSEGSEKTELSEAAIRRLGDRALDFRYTL
ncbi:MFS general substrate transporter [Trametes meyenii]|nr:MFS general substrate transporter [Trametes meyenii]